jgi:hypothetical protein
MNQKTRFRDAVMAGYVWLAWWSRLGFCMRRFLLAAGVLVVACSHARLYYLDSELGTVAK